MWRVCHFSCSAVTIYFLNIKFRIGLKFGILSISNRYRFIGLYIIWIRRYDRTRSRFGSSRNVCETENKNDIRFLRDPDVCLYRLYRLRFPPCPGLPSAALRHQSGVLKIKINRSIFRRPLVVDNVLIMDTWPKTRRAGASVLA